MPTFITEAENISLNTTEYMQKSNIIYEAQTSWSIISNNLESLNFTGQNIDATFWHYCNYETQYR